MTVTLTSPPRPSRHIDAVLALDVEALAPIPLKRDLSFSVDPPRVAQNPITERD